MTSSPPAPPVRLEGRAAVAIHAAFVVIGCSNVILGPLIPRLHAQQGVPLDALGILFPVQFAAQAVGAVLSSRDVRRSLWLGYAIVAAGLGLLSLGWPGAILAITLTGIGVGLVIPASNVLVAQAHPSRRAAALSQLNVLWGLGAFGVPLVFAQLGGATPALLALGAAGAAIVLGARLPAMAKVAAGAPPVSITRGAVWTFALLTLELFLYTGAEAAAGGWVIALAADRGAATGLAGANYVGSAFWGSLLFGRLAAPAVLERVSERTLQRGGLGLAAAGCAGILLARSPLGTAAAALVTGLGLAPLFPLIAARLVGFAELHRSPAAGVVFAVGGLGAGALPWLAGFTAARFGGLWLAFLVPLGALVAMAGLFTFGPRADDAGATKGPAGP